MPRYKILTNGIFACFLLAVPLPGTEAHATRGPGMIRDTEVENTIRMWIAPLLKAAHLDSESFRLHIIRDRNLNAFVAGDQRLFLPTGLLRRSDSANQVIGVMAHEIGHITGGHLTRLRGKVDKLRSGAMISQLLGVAVGLLARDPAAGIAVGSGSMQVVQRSFLKFSRAQESAADQAAMTMLDATGQSSRGILQFLKKLSSQELLRANRQDPYVRTHPLTQNRISFVRNHVRRSRYSDRTPSPEFSVMHRRMVAKLDGFLDPPARTLRKYKDNDVSIGARYARAIAYYRSPDLTKAMPLIDGLIAEHPMNPFFRELKGQMLFENARGKEALPNYREAVRLLPDAPQLRIGLAHVQIELGGRDNLDKASGNLSHALERDRDYAIGWRLAVVAHGRSGRLGRAAWSQAEDNLLVGRSKEAGRQAKKALRLLKEGSPAWIRAQDIQQRVKQIKKKTRR